jgi:hypothetical protein
VSDSGKIGNIKNRTGVSGKLFKGELTTINYNMALPGANAGEIVNVTMLGSELVDILQNGLVIESDDGTSASFDYYALGVTYDVLGDSTLTNLMLSDGSPLAMDRQYRITMVSNDFVEKDSYNVDSTGVSVNDAYLDYLSKHPTI